MHIPPGRDLTLFKETLKVFEEVHNEEGHIVFAGLFSAVGLRVL